MLACTCFVLALAAVAPPVVGVHVNVWNGTSDVTLLDPETHGVRGTATFKGVASPLRFDASAGTLFVAVTRKRATSVWSIDGTSVSSAHVADLGKDVADRRLDPEGSRLYVVAGHKKSKPRTVTSLDLASGRMRHLTSVERMAGVSLSPDGRLLYALCEGKTHKKPKGPPGSVHVVDTSTGAELARLDGGEAPRRVEFDPQRDLAYVLGATDAQGNGILTVVRRTEVVGRFATPGIPAALRLAPDGAAFVLTSRAVVALGANGTGAAKRWDLDFGPSDLVFDLEHDLMFAGAGAGSKIAEMRISGGDVLAEHPTGSAGRKFGKGVGAAVYFVFAVAAAAGGASIPSPFFTVQNSTSMLLGEDGGTLYVLNPYTNDVSIFDVARQDVVDIVHVGGSCRRIVRLPGEPGFWVEASDRLARFDTATNRIDRTVALHGLVNRSVAYDPARKLAWISLGAKILIIDLRTGELAGQIDLPKAVAFLWYE